MEYFQSLFELPLEFWLSVGIGCIATFLFCFGEFEKPTFIREVDKPETQFFPRELTSRQDYLLSFILYVLGLEFIYLTISIIGPAPFVELGLASGAPTSFQTVGAFPLWVALVMVGVLPRLPFFSFIEQSWRRAMHERASIPQAAVSLSRELRRAEFDFSSFQAEIEATEGKDPAWLRGASLDPSQLSPSHRWAKLSALVWRLSSLELDPGLEGYIDFEFVNRHRSELDAIRFRYRQLSERIEAAQVHDPEPAAGMSEAPGRYELPPAPAEISDRAASGTDGSVPNELVSDIEATLRRTCIFLACALIAKTVSRRALSSAIGRLGFTSSMEFERVGVLDVAIQAFLYAAFGFFVFTFFVSFFDESVPDSVAETGWPQWESTDVFLWTFSAILMHGSALTCALMVRSYLRSRQMWFGGSFHERKSPRVIRYVTVGTASYLVALIVMSYWDGVLRGADVIWGDLHVRYPLALVPASSAVFECMLFDRVYVQSGQARLWPIVTIQTLLGALLAFIAASHLYKDFQPDMWGAIAFTTVSATLFIFILGQTTAALMRAARDRYGFHEIEEGATALSN